MDWMRTVSRLGSDLRSYVDRKVATLVKFGGYSVSGSSGKTDKIRGFKTEGSDEQAYDYEGRRMSPFGLRSVPPTDTFGVWVGIAGSSTNGVILAGDTDNYGPDDLAVGEIALYNKVNGTTIKLDANGAISLTAASGQLVTLNGADYHLAKWDDFLTDFATWATALNVLLTAIVPVTGAPAPAKATYATAIGLPASLIVKMATPLNYESSKVKNG